MDYNAFTTPPTVPIPRRKEEENENNFWIEFQVFSDGLELPPAAAAAASGPETAATAAAVATTFPRFGDLPPEIRLKIWAELIQPRVVIAACVDAEHLAERREQLAARPRRPAVPVLLHACHEARELALRHYQLAFGWKTPYILASAGGRREAPPRAWFNFALDGLLLLGELEPHDAFGVSTPSVYFLPREDTHRVRRVACAFEGLRHGEYDSQRIFSCLFHVLDRFPLAARLLITSTDADVAAARELLLPSGDNVIQRIWWAWIHGSTVVTSELADRQMIMVHEAGLPAFAAGEDW